MFNRLTRLLLLLLLPFAVYSQEIHKTISIEPDNDGTIGELRLEESDGYTAGTSSHYFFQRASAAMSASWGVTWPAAAPGSAGCMRMGAGGLITIDPACSGTGGTVAGADRDMQINDSSTFGVVTLPSRIYAPDQAFTDLVILTESGANSSADLTLQTYAVGTPIGGRFRTYTSRGTAAAPVALQTDDPIGRWVVLGYDGSAFQDRGMFRFRAAENWSGSAQGTYLEFWTTAIGATSRTERWNMLNTGAWAPATDGGVDVGTSTLWVGTGYFDTVASGELQVWNSAHSAHRSIAYNDGDGTIELWDTSNNPVLEVSNAGVITAYGAILADTDGTNDIGSNTVRFRDIYADDLDANVLRMANGGHNLFYTWTHSGTDLDLDDTSGVELISFSSGVEPKIRLNADMAPGTGGFTDLGSETFYFGEVWGTDLYARLNLRVRNGSGDVRFSASGASDDGLVNIYNSSDDVVIALQAAGAGGQNNSGEVFLSDSSNRTKWLAGINSSGQGYLTLRESGAGTGDVILTADGSAPDLRIAFQSGGDLFPSGDGINDNGLPNNPWQVTRTETLDLGDNTQSAGSGEGAQLIGISKDGADTVEVDNWSCSDDGNCYQREVTSSISCTGVDNAWFAVRTDSSNEKLVVCIGGSAYHVVLSSGS